MKLIHDLRNTVGSAAKIKLLKTADEDAKKVLYYTYNIDIVFNLTRLSGTAQLGEPNLALFTVLKLIRCKKLTGEHARQAVIRHAEEYGDLIYLIVRKDLNCGISRKSVNKAFPGLVPMFDVQLAKEVPLYKLKYPMLAEVKYDGVRVIAKVEANKQCMLYTRNGNRIYCPSLSEPIAYRIKEDCMLDGELTTADGKMSGRTTISGRVNSALQGDELTCVDLRYTVFDYMPLEMFNAGKCNIPYTERHAKVLKHVDDINHELIHPSYAHKVHSSKEANTYYESLILKGYEGTILKGPKHMYTFKRSKDWVKVKAVESAELVCIGTRPGKPGTKYENCIGALECKGMVLGKFVQVNVGSGLSDEQRNLPDKSFIGKTIEVMYNNVMQNSSKRGYTLFLPRFVAIRLDK